jgi:amino acid adenylation domain-containing protein
MKKDTESMVQSYLSENYWLGKLENVTYNALYGGKTDLDDSSVKTFDQSRFSLPGPLAETLEKITGDSNAKAFLMFITALNILAYKYTGINDILIAAPGFRDDDPGEYKDVLLFFKTEVNEDSSIRDLLNTAFSDLNEAYEHRHFDYQFFFDRFCQQNPGNREALTALGLLYDGFNRESGLADGIDLLFSIRQHSGEFVLIIKYDTQEYQQHQVDQLGRHFITILTSMPEDLDKTPRQIDILSGEDRRKLLVDFSGKTVDYRLEEKTFISSFEAQVKRSPMDTAVKCEDKTLTYLQLNEISNRLARIMQKEGAVLREDLVAILMERSEKMSISIIAAWKCGAAYVPIDPDYPGHRVKTIIEDSGSKLVITEKGILHPQLESDLKSMAKIVYLDEMEKILENQSSKDLNIDIQPGDLAYIIYTSGSTGQPKGVMVEHRGMMNHLYAKIADIQFDSESVVVQNASQCFDISIWQFFAALLVGGRTVIYPQWLVLSPETLIRRAGTDGVTILEVVPSYLSMMLDTIDERKLQHVFPVLRYLLVTGETVRPGLVKRWFEKFPGIKMVNAYGPTEASDDITHFIMDRFPGGDSIPIGRTLRNFRIYILDSRMKLCPPGIKGEICVSGTGVGRGYLNDIQKTVSAFVEDPFSHKTGARMYRTGDIGRYLADGNIEFFGRKDYQVKIRGFRIEMEEIENKLSTMEGIGTAVVIDKEDKSGNKHLYAYVTLTGGTGKKQEEIKRQLRDVLPEYMIPSKIVIMESLPLTPNGKVDRKALPEPGEEDIRGMEYVAPRNAMEKKLAEIWQEVLGIEKIAVHDNFFNLGGDSFKGIHIVNKVQEWLQEVVHVTVLFLAPTIEELAVKLESYKKVDFETRVGAVEIAEIRSLIQPLAPLPSHLAPTAKKSPVMFILCPSRSGSTLLRVILAGHPKLFAPQEFELLSFNTLAERKEALSGKFSLYLEGVIRAIMEIKQIDADEAKAIMEGFEAQGMTVPEFYGVLQSWLDGRILVEKTPQYTYDMEVLKRAETYFDSPLYIHLVRHPYAVIHSYENARLDQLFKYEHRFSSRQLGELLWLTCHQNILEFLENIPASRRYQMKYEDLVGDPEAIVSQMCHHFGLEFYPPMLDIYEDAEKRMTDGIYAESKMLGDVKFFTHKSIDTHSVEKWKEKYKTHFLGDETVKIAKSFGYLEEIIAYSKIGIAPQKEHYTLSPAQKRLWILNSFQENNTAYNIPKVYLVTGNLEITALEKAYETVLRRHQSLRTTFITVEGEPRQKINDFQSMGFKLEYVDLRNEKDREEQSKNLTLQEAGAAFDLEKGPLLRIKLIHLEDKKYIFLFNMHHIISDGWSMLLLTNEILTLYVVSKNGGDTRLPGLRFQYKDYSEWLNRESMKQTLKKQEEYWLKEYEGEIPVLNLPIDYSRPSVWSFEGNTTGFELTEEETGSLNKLARSEGVSLFIVLLAVYNIFLAKISGQEDIVVGIVTAGRNHPDMERIIGLFVNTLALRNYPAGEMGFKAFLHQVKQRTLRSLENQDYPFEELVEKVVLNRDMSHNPLIDAMFVLQNISEPAGEVHQVEMNDVALEPYPYEQTISKFDLSLNAVEMGKKVRMSFEYGTRLFKEETIHRFIQHFKKVISSVTREPAKSLGEIEIISGEEKKRVLSDFNETETVYPADKTIHELFGQQVRRTPDHIAVIGPQQTKHRDHMTYISYRELDVKSHQLAAFLIEKGIKPDTVVGIKVERSVEMLIGILGILKAGGAYLPIDPEYPRERINFMLEDSEAKVLLTAPDLASTFEPPSSTSTCQVSSTNLAYIIYTSGTSGKPKGVLVEHRNVVTYLDAFFREFHINSTDVGIQLASYSFDIFIEEVFPILLKGGKIVIPGVSQRLDIDLLYRLIVNQQVNIIDCTPLLLNEFNKLASPVKADNPLKSVHTFISGGDVLKKEYVDNLLTMGTVYNTYGPTETTVCASYCNYKECSSFDVSNVPIGKPISNYSIYIMGKNNELQSIGVTGELYVSGPGVTRGYLNQPELTAEKFLFGFYSFYRSYKSYKSYVLYKTGDLGRWLPEGDIEFLGRIDNQVKIRGYRIEVGEIESQLKNHKKVKEAVVITREDKNGDKDLCAYIIASSSGEDVDEFREYLSSKLPDYMIPSYFVELAEMPLTPNGKIDRKALPEPGIKPGEEYVAPGNVMEKKLAAIWQEILGIENIGIKSGFFQLGGNSLKVITLISFIHRDFGIKLPVVEIFRHDTVKKQVELLLTSPVDPFASIEPAPAADCYAVSSVQRRLFFLQLFNPRNMSYNMQVILLLEGEYKREKIETIFAQLIHRHESYRTSFHMIDDEPKQRVHQPDTVDFAVEYYRAEGNKSFDESAVIDAFIRPFDLSLPPLFRVGIIHLDHTRWIFMMDMHHIISDGISQAIFNWEFMALYMGEELPPLRIQYKDFAQWLNKEEQVMRMRQQEAYWLKRFEGELPLLLLPTDYNRPAAQTFEGGKILFQMGEALTAALKAYAAQEAATLFMLTQALFNLVLSRLSGQEDIIIGTSLAGRRHAELEGIIGMFVNALALRNYPARDKSFREFLREVKENTLEAFENQDYQMEDLLDKASVERVPGRNPLFDVMLVLNNEEYPDVEIPGLKLEWYPYKKKTAQMDLKLRMMEVAGNLSCTIEYSSTLFREETIKRFANYFKMAAGAALADPLKRLAEIDILPEQEKQRLLLEFNDSEKTYPLEIPLHRLFEQQAQRTPGNIAVFDPSAAVIQYQQLNRNANQLARLLRKHGVRTGAVVGLMMERSIDMVTALLAILKTGGAYLPIDTGLPRERVRYMLEDSDARILLSNSRAVDEITFTALQDFESKSDKTRSAWPV